MVWNAPLLGIDWGERRIGLAITDDFLRFAERLAIVPWSRPLKDLPGTGSSVISELKDLVRSRGVQGIVFGIPWYHLSGDINPKATLFLAIGRRLNILLGLPVYFWDEGMTSDQARKSIKINPDRGKRKSRLSEPIDSLSAALMLQSFLDERVKSRPIEKEQALGEDD